MKTKPLTFLLALTFLFLFSGSVYGDDEHPKDLFDGFDAYLREDFQTAYKLFAPLAEQGNRLAQSSLAAMYKYGHGVPEDFKEAVRWYRLSAEQGEAEAQNFLGTIYKDGKGVPQDYALAHMWFNLSVSNA
jgi:hypothetical protein